MENNENSTNNVQGQNIINYTEKKKSKGTTIIIVILVILVLGLTGYIVYDKVLSKEEKKENNSTTETTKKENELEKEEAISKPEKISFDKKEVNEWLNGLTKTLINAFDATDNNIGYYNIDFNKFETNKEILNNNNSKFCFAWEDTVYHEKLNCTEINKDGEEETGARTCQINDISEYYKKLYGEEMSNATSYNCGAGPYKDYIIKDNLVYGYQLSGAIGQPAIAKIDSIIKENDIFTLNIDVIDSYNENADNPWEKLELYTSPSVTEYDKSLVVAKLEMQLQKIDNNYVIKSLKKVS